MADDGLARAIRLAHGTGDGDTVFTLATGTVTVNPNINQIGGAAADVLSRSHPRDPRRGRHPCRHGPELVQREQLLRVVPTALPSVTSWAPRPATRVESRPIAIVRSCPLECRAWPFAARDG